LILVNLVVVSKGLKALGDDLHTHRAADRQYVDERFTILIGLQLHISPVFAVLDGVKDDRGIYQGLAAAVAHNGDLDARGGLHRLEFAPALGAWFLSADNEHGVERGEYQASDGHGDGEAMK